MANVDREIREVETGERNLLHMKKLADAMAPDPREWEYTGDMGEDGSGQAHCACGHPIRYLFPITRKRDGAVLIIGSVCIDTSIPYLTANGAEVLAEALQGAREKLEELLKERQRLIREARGSARYQAISGKAEVLHAWIEKALVAVNEDAKRRGRRAPFLPNYFYTGKYRQLVAEPTASTPGRAAAGLASKVKTAMRECGFLAEGLNKAGFSNCVSPLPDFEAGENETPSAEMAESPEEEEAIAAPERAETPEVTREARDWSELYSAQIQASSLFRQAAAGACQLEAVAIALRKVREIEVRQGAERDPEDLAGLTYHPTVGPYKGQEITVLGRVSEGSLRGGEWLVMAPDSRNWVVGGKGLKKALER